jgi:serine/threonine protein kinase
MPIAAGTRFGSYEITGSLGAGGMGEVYRATDTKLGREVAIKTLPSALAKDTDRLARFEREAKLLAALNHAHIAAIYGLDEHEGTQYLAMELVEGETLEQKLKPGRLPVEDALRLALQIAEALEAAHEKGVVHRDLKPANIMVTPNGQVKVLDFGLAKAFSGDPNEASPLHSPALSIAMTQQGLILGTAGYMSPEQASGQATDQRADIWAFGVVLYEMLTGLPLFSGESVPHILAAVLQTQPDWQRLPKNLHPRLTLLLERCLEKKVRNRYHAMADVRVDIERILSDPQGTTGPAAIVEPLRPLWKRALPITAAVLSAAAVGTLVWFLRSGSPPPAPSTSFVIRTPGDVPLATAGPVAFSPDGRDLVYAVGLVGQSHVFRQSLGRFEPQALSGGDGAQGLFFSPGGEAVGFWSAGEFQRLALDGGAASKVTDAPGSMGASWSNDGALVFSPVWASPLRILRPGASEAQDLTRIDGKAGEVSHLWPQVLPGNHDVLFTIWDGGSWNDSELAVADLTIGQHKLVLRGGTYGRYSSSGHLVFWRGNALWAVPFDLATLTVAGEPRKVVEGVRLNQGNGEAHVAVSRSGALAYVKGGEDAFAECFVVDRSGRTLMRLDEAASTGQPAFSPDGSRLALTVYRGGAYAVGVFDLGRGLLTRIAVTADNLNPGWTSGGDRVTFVSNRDGEYSLYSVRSDGSGMPEPLFTKAQGFISLRPASSPDGGHLLYGKQGDIWEFEPGKKAEPRPLIASAANEAAPEFSPDGRFVVYQSDESGKTEVYVRPFPDVDTARELISRSGGRNPVWTRDGKEIFYVTEAGLMEAPVSFGGGSKPSFGQPTLALKMSGIKAFDVSPDGQTFAIERLPIDTAAREIHVVVNWFSDLERLVPAK